MHILWCCSSRKEHNKDPPVWILPSEYSGVGMIFTTFSSSITSRIVLQRIWLSCWFVGIIVCSGVCRHTSVILIRNVFERQIKIELLCKCFSCWCQADFLAYSFRYLSDTCTQSDLLLRQQNTIFTPIKGWELTQGPNSDNLAVVGLEPGTFWSLAQYFNHYADHRWNVLQLYNM